jgi:hypothetical protein
MLINRTKVSRLEYSQFLLVTQKNYTLTYFAEHSESISHDAINRYLSREKLTPTLLWEHQKNEIVSSVKGLIIFDDSVLDKTHSEFIELSKWQYSGAVKDIVKGIGMVTCAYYNPEIKKFWAIDYRIYAPEQDGKTKINHVLDMLNSLVYSKKLEFHTVLMDTWYATTEIILTIDSLGKIFYCPIRKNRLVSKTDQKYHHIPVVDLPCSADELSHGQRIHINKFPKNYQAQLFRITVNSHRTDFIVTNDKAQKTSKDIQEVYGYRWCIEELHRELKQLTGIQNCQCRKERIQRNHIACSFMVWARLKSVAYKINRTIYHVKNHLLNDYIKQQLRSPTISMAFA